MCGIDLPVCEMTYEELQQISLGHTQEKIPLFQDVLTLVHGQVPLLVEIKPVSYTHLDVYKSQAQKVYFFTL